MEEQSDRIASFFLIVDRLGLSDLEISAATGLAVNTIRIVRARRQPPQRKHCIQAIDRFVQANAAATARTDVRLAASF